MAHTQFEAMTTKPFITDQISNLVADASSSPLCYILPPCLVLLAIDVVTRLSHRPTPAAVLVEQEHDLSMEEVTHQLGHRAQRVLRDFSRLESILSEGLVRSGQLCRTLEKRRNFAHHRHRLEVENARVRQAYVSGPARRKSAKSASTCYSRAEGVSKPFENFCQRLLLQNRIWKQEKEIKALKGNSDIRDVSSAFKAFCDRLLLSNQVWGLQREIKRLTEEGEQLKRSRVAAVTRAAKQMVQDVRKERLTEEFVKELLAEVDEYKRTIGSLRAEHEEMAEVAEGWKKDYQRMSKEIELLQLAQEARLVEQDISNQIEGDLLERLALQEQNFPSMLMEDDDLETLSGCSDLDGASSLSTSTVVGSPEGSPNGKLSFSEDTLKPKATRKHPPLTLSRRTITSEAIEASATSKFTTPARRFDPEPYVGFSFNPLFFGNTSITRQDDDSLKVESPLNIVHVNLKSLSARSSRAGSLPSPSATGPKGKQALQKPVKACWRV